MDSFSGKPTGRLVDKKSFIPDGTLAVLPFKAGEGVAADPQLDRMSLMISKGIIDYLKEEKLPFEILLTQDQGDPQMLVEGYIESFKKSSRLGVLFFRPRKSQLNVSGQVIVVSNKERILVFKHVKSTTDPQKSGLDLAYHTGHDLGRFIADAIAGE